MKIIASDPISEKAAAELEKIGDLTLAYDKSPEELREIVKDAQVLIVRSKTTVDKELINSASNLKAIVRAGVGIDNIDAEYAKSKNIQVINTPEAPSDSVAELAIGLMLSLLRQIPRGDSGVKAKKWEKKELKGHELYGKTVGIVGCGRIGHRIAKLLKGFDLKVLVYDPHMPEKDLPEGAEKAELEKLLTESDIITLHVPLLPATKGMIGEKEFSLMKETAYIINTARGPVIDEEALYNALKNKKIAGVALDVFWEKKPFNSKVMELDNIIFTPHLGGNTYEAQDRIGDLLVEKIKKLNL
jgi:D-3-phosphoglycerate dehydrogenase